MPYDTNSSITVTKLKNLDTLVIKQRGASFFITTRDSIVIDVNGLYMIIQFLVLNKMLDPNVLERILDEFYTAK